MLKHSVRIRLKRPLKAFRKQLPTTPDARKQPSKIAMAQAVFAMFTAAKH